MIRGAVYVVVMSALLWLASFALMPLAVRWEFSPAVVDRIPLAGFLLGGVLGLLAAFREPVRDVIWISFASIVLGCLAWLFVVFVVGLGLSIGGFEDELFDRAMEPVNTVATWIGWLIALGGSAVGIYAIVSDPAAALLARVRPKRKTP